MGEDSNKKPPTSLLKYIYIYIYGNRFRIYKKYKARVPLSSMPFILKANH